MTPTLAQLLAAGEISRLDAHFGECVARLGAGDLDDAGRADLATLAALASRATAAGHVCLPLAEIAGAPVLRAATGDDGPSERGDEAARAALGTLSWPALEAWQAVLLRSAAAGDGSRVTPLVLDASRRLYLHRLWEAERELKAQVSRRVACPPDAVDESWLSGALRRLFPRGADDIDAAVEWRALACLVVMTRRFAVVSGGPGTGKTTGVIRLLALLIEQAFAAGKTLRIALVAPTGKAAARLQETVDAQRGQLPVPESVRAALPRETTTIHRRLGSYVTGFYYGRDNRIPYDIVVVDEASMVDLPLMAHLVGALEDDARLVLLGDRDQLASVQPGAVLGDICRAAEARGASASLGERFSRVAGAALPGVKTGGGGLGDVVVQLHRNFRFNPASGIGRLAARAVAGDADGVIAALRDGSSSSTRLVVPAGARGIERSVCESAVRAYRAYLDEAELSTAYTSFLGFRVLCAHRRGEGGAEQLNPRIEAALAGAGLVPRAAEWYRGRPVLVTENDATSRLFNGDVGLAWPDEGGNVLVHFPDGRGGFRRFPPSRLPAHETVYAMTVHKSQGSEFGSVLLVLPPAPSPVVTRELIYTGVTRAREAVTVLGDESVLRAAVAASVTRYSAGWDDVARGP